MYTDKKKPVEILLQHSRKKKKKNKNQKQKYWIVGGERVSVIPCDSELCSVF